jgi:hypothetical protein
MAANKSMRNARKRVRTNRSSRRAGIRPAKCLASSHLQALESTIETERRRLGKAQSILGCLAIALGEEPARSPTAPYYADVAEAIRDMMNCAIERLDAVNLARR